MVSSVKRSCAMKNSELYKDVEKEVRILIDVHGINAVLESVKNILKDEEKNGNVYFSEEFHEKCRLLKQGIQCLLEKDNSGEKEIL